MVDQIFRKGAGGQNLRVTGMKIVPVAYMSAEGLCHGSNLLYRVDGRPRSSRVPWVAQDAGAESARIGRLLERTGR
jgi:hypothetical protein